MLPNFSHNLYSLPSIKVFVFNPYTFKGAGRTSLISHSSCTFKAPTLLGKALFHQQTTKLPQTTQKPQKRRAQCHHFVLELWFFKDEYLFAFYFLSSSFSKLFIFIPSCLAFFCVLIWFECLFIHFNRWVLFKIVLEHLFSILCRILDIFVLLFFYF